MTNTEIRIEAQRIFRQLVIATHNDAYGEDDGTMNILNCRMMKAIRWAKENGEFETLKAVCSNMFKGGIGGMGLYADECLSLFEL